MVFRGTVWLIAEAHAWKGDVEKGLEITEELLARDPDSAPALGALGIQQVALGRYDAAMATADRLSATGQEGEKAEGIRAAALALTGRWDEARERAASAARTNKPRERLYATFILSAIEAYTGRLSKALARLDEVARIPGLPPEARGRSHLSAADMLYAAGRYEPALREARLFAEAAKGTTEEGLSRSAVALCLTRLKRGGEAATELAAAEKSLAGVPRELRQVQDAYVQAHLALARGEPAKAVDALVAVLPMLPEQGLESDEAARVRHELGVAYMEAGQDAESVRWLTRFTDSGLDRLKLPIQYARSLYRLGQLHEKRGDTAKAREYYRLFAQLWKDGELDREQVAEATRKAGPLSVASR
jgi:tetratricopeptide (TPR) repeat protein